MSRIFEVAEKDIAPILDALLKQSGLAVHGVVKAIEAVLKEKPVAPPVSSSEPSPGASDASQEK